MSYTISNGFNIAASCQSCQGQGIYISKEATCTGCGGRGKIRERKNVEVRVSAGIEDGMRIQLPGMGDVPLEGKGAPGDLYVRVQVIPSKLFRRQGANIYQEKTIPFYTAILGGKVRVRTLNTEVDVRVPSGTQPGADILLRGEGMPRLRSGGKGDMNVKFNVRLPT